MSRTNGEQQNEDYYIYDENEQDTVHRLSLDACSLDTTQVREEECRDYNDSVLVVISNWNNNQICAPYLVCALNTLFRTSEIVMPHVCAE